MIDWRKTSCSVGWCDHSRSLTLSHQFICFSLPYFISHDSTLCLWDREGRLESLNDTQRLSTAAWIHDWYKPQTITIGSELTRYEWEKDRLKERERMTGGGEANSVCYIGDAQSSNTAKVGARTERTVLSRRQTFSVKMLIILSSLSPTAVHNSPDANSETALQNYFLAVYMNMYKCLQITT